MFSQSLTQLKPNLLKMDYFTKLPNELVIDIFERLDIVSKEYFTYTFMRYYELFKEEKRDFIEKNFDIDYKFFRRLGKENFVNKNLTCIHRTLRKKKFLLTKFPKIFTETLIDINTPVINIDIFPDWFIVKTNNVDPVSYKKWEPFESSLLKYDKYIGLNKNDNLIILKTKDKSDVVTIWKNTFKSEWYIIIDEKIHIIHNERFIDFRILENIISQI